MRREKVEGIVIKRTNFGEADKILTVFTKGRGKIKVLAKGIRKIKSRRAPHLELFNQVQLVLHKGRTFDTIIEARVLADYTALKSNLKLSGYLFYMAEVVDKILPEHQLHPDVLDILIRTVRSLGSTRDAGVKEFVVELLWSLGYLPKGEYPKIGVTSFVENIVEKRIRSKKFLEEI